MSASMEPARVSLFFPVYRDEATTALMIAKAVRFLSSVGAEYEIVVVVVDASPDRSGAIADALALDNPCVRVMPRLLRFDGRGVAITLDLAQSAATLRLLRRVDELTIAAGGLPHVITR